MHCASAVGLFSFVCQPGPEPPQPAAAEKALSPELAGQVLGLAARAVASIVDGTAAVVNGDQEITLQTNQSTYIPAGHKHRLSNPGVVDLVMIEVQSGPYLGEDDIVRFDDRYGRI